MTQRQSSLEEILKAHVQTLALSLQPETVKGYRGVVRSFVAYLHRVTSSISTTSLNCAAIPISLAGSAVCASSNRL